MRSCNSLCIGDISSDGSVKIIDQDRLCYVIQSSSRGAKGIRTISKKLLNEFVEYLETNNETTANNARVSLCGKSEIDKFEYGYAASLLQMAKMILEKGVICNTNENESPQQIYYGSPGTGKSHKIKEKLAGVSKENIFRTTFHPDTDYASFVGCYKPITKCGKVLKRVDYSIDDLAAILKKNYEDADIKTVALHSFALEYADYFNGAIAQYNKKDLVLKAGLSEDYKVEINKIVNLFGWMKAKGYINTNDSIAYEFVPQTFTNAYIKAWEDTTKPVYLIIEEINRGNCAQIFGDLFQLLDRDKATGKSEYPIKADKDLVVHIEKVLGAGHEGIKNGELCLPSNLYIYATMNTSDQSLFPIDSAFKRRWDWEYEPIKYKNTNWIIDINGNKYSWVSFQREINKRIFEATCSEDKMLGDYFVNPADGIVTEKILLNKILFYLWNDVCKDGEGDIFKTADNEEITFSDLHGDGGTDKLIAMMKYLNVQHIKNDENDVEDGKVSDGIYTKRHLKVVFPDGITYEANNSTDTLISTINKIGPEKVYQLNIKLSDYPFISKEKLSDDGRGYGNSQRELNEGYYVTTKLSTDAKLAKIQEISQRLNCGLSVSIIEL